MRGARRWGTGGNGPCDNRWREPVRKRGQREGPVNVPPAGLRMRTAPAANPETRLAPCACAPAAHGGSPPWRWGAGRAASPGRGGQVGGRQGLDGGTCPGWGGRAGKKHNGGGRAGATSWRRRLQRDAAPPGGGEAVALDPGAGLVPGVTSLVWRQRRGVIRDVITRGAQGDPCVGLRGAQAAAVGPRAGPAGAQPRGSPWGQTVLKGEAPSSVLAWHQRQKFRHKAEAELFRVRRRGCQSVKQLFH